MEERESKMIITILVCIILILCIIVGGVLFVNTKSNITKGFNGNVSSNYARYLTNLEDEIRKNYNDSNKNQIRSNSVVLNTYYTVTITKDLELMFNTDDKKFDNVKLSDNVVNMFLIDYGNGGFKYLYFIKTDGTLNKICIDNIRAQSPINIEKTELNNIVNVTQGIINDEVSGDLTPIFIDIDGNMVIDNSLNAIPDNSNLQ